MNIGKTIRDLRKEREYTQLEFAKLCSITQTSLSLIENNQTRPNPETMKKITDSLNVPESYIYLLSIDQKDIPQNKQFLFNKLYPSVKDMLKNLLLDDEKS